jgi:hypothetical protein
MVFSISRVGLILNGNRFQGLSRSRRSQTITSATMRRKQMPVNCILIFMRSWLFINSRKGSSLSQFRKVCDETEIQKRSAFPKGIYPVVRYRTRHVSDPGFFHGGHCCSAFLVSPQPWTRPATTPPSGFPVCLGLLSLAITISIT